MIMISSNYYTGCGKSNRTHVLTHKFIKTKSNKTKIQSNDREITSEQK